MTCQELVDFIVDYLGGDLPETQRRVFERHLRDCAPCVRFLETYRDTISLGRCACDDPEAPIPDEVPERLVEAILAAQRGDPEVPDERD